MKIINTSQWASLYSTEQDAFHAEPFAQTVKTNIEMCAKKNGNDYLITGIHGTREEALAFNNKIRKMQESLESRKKAI